MRFDFRTWLLSEGRSEQLAAAILKKADRLRDLPELTGIDTSKNHKNLPAICHFYIQNISVIHLADLFEKIEKHGIAIQYVNGNVICDGKPVTFLKLSEIADAKSQKHVRRNAKAQPQGAPLASANGIEVYGADSEEKCIKLGRGYPFCISRTDGNNMWSKYRFFKTSNFYFVFDRSRPDTDPLHIVVVDVQPDKMELTDASNKTGDIAEFGENVEGYLDYLHGKGIDPDIFQPKPLTDQEEEDHALLKDRNHDSNWFKNLTHDQKLKYIARHHPSHGQIRQLVQDGPKDVLDAFLSQGNELHDEALQAIAANPGTLKAYLKYRVRKQTLTQKEFPMALPFPDILQKFIEKRVFLYPDQLQALSHMPNILQRFFQNRIEYIKKYPVVTGFGQTGYLKDPEFKFLLGLPQVAKQYLQLVADNVQKYEKVQKLLLGDPRYSLTAQALKRHTGSVVNLANPAA